MSPVHPSQQLHILLPIHAPLTHGGSHTVASTESEVVIYKHS